MIDIRSLDETKWQLLRDLRLRALSDSPNSFVDSLAATRERSELEWLALFDKGAYFVAHENNEPIGMSGCIRLDEAAERREIKSMWVDARRRGQGVGLALVQPCIEWAESDGASEIELWFCLDNASALRSYEKAGFVLSGRTWPNASNPHLPWQQMLLALPLTRRTRRL